MIRRLFETGQHEDRILHLLNTESSDTQNFSLISHDVSQQHDVSRIDRHSVRRHGMLNFIIDRLSSSLDTKHITGLHNVIRSCLDSIDTVCTHDFCQSVSGNEQSIDAAIFLVFGDDTSVDLG